MDRADRAAYVTEATYEQIPDAMLRAVNATDRRLTQDDYQAWASRRPGVPGLHLVQQIAGENGKTFAGVRSEVLALRAAGVQPADRELTVLLYMDRVGAEVIVIMPPTPKLAGVVGRPRKYQTPAERREAINARRRAARAARAQGMDPPQSKRQLSRYASPPEERDAANARRPANRGGSPAATDGSRRRFKRADGKRIQRADLIKAGLIAADAELYATRAGRRFTCRYTSARFEVDGLGQAASLSGAAVLAVYGPQDGWSFWRVGPEPGTPVFKLRRQLVDQLTTDES